MKKENVVIVARTLLATFAAIQAIMLMAAIALADTFVMKPQMTTIMNLERRFYYA